LADNKHKKVIVKALAAKAAKGNVAAADKLLGLVIQAVGLEDERPATRRLSETDELIRQGGVAEDLSRLARPL